MLGNETTMKTRQICLQIQMLLSLNLFWYISDAFWKHLYNNFLKGKDLKERKYFSARIFTEKNKANGYVFSTAEWSQKNMFTI